MNGMNTWVYLLLLQIMLVILNCSTVYCQNIYFGTIHGKVSDADTREPLAGASVFVQGTTIGASTDTEGNFIIEKVPVGNYILQFNYIGYQNILKPDIIIKPERIIYVAAELKCSEIEMDSVIVSAGYFSNVKEQPVSIVNLSGEEIRRGAGSAGDISRILFSLPSVSKVSDNQNSLVVRGGSPSENIFYIDNFEVPNINHFPVQGSSAGHTGILNVDLIKDVNFYTGGFSAIYGNKLSSVMDLSLREGNKEENDFQADLGMAAAGIIGEGPLDNGKGAWVLSARHSFSDLVIPLFVGDEETTHMGFSDLQGKIIYNLSEKHKLTLLNISAYDFFSSNRESAYKDGDNSFGNGNILQSTSGIDWQYLWGSKGYSDLVLSYTVENNKSKYFTTITENKAIDLHSSDQFLKLRNINFFRINSSNSIDAGFDTKLNWIDYNNYYAQYTDITGNNISGLTVNEKENILSLGAFLNYNLKLSGKLTLNPGIRVDYNNYNRNVHISPRVSVTLEISNTLSVSGAAGIFYQTLPMILLSQNEDYKRLADPEAYHYVIGIRKLMSESMQLTIEGYFKKYSGFPVNPAQPDVFIVDQVVTEDYFLNHETLKSSGKAYSTGCELMFQKKLSDNIYGTLSATYFISRYSGSDGKWKNRIFDNRFIFNIEGGYKPNLQWELSLRWSYAGGIPYSPFNRNLSEELNKGIIDVNNINNSRLPAYHSLNIRIDKRFIFSSTNLILFVDIWNVYGRKNVPRYIWNEVKKDAEPLSLWTNTIIPAFGLEYEF